MAEAEARLEKKGALQRVLGDDVHGNYALIAVLTAIAMFATRSFIVGCSCDEIVDLTNRTVIITGASDGIGLETARHLHRLGAHVVLPVRNTTKGKSAMDDILASNLPGSAEDGAPSRVTVKHMDLNSISSVKKFVFDFNRMKLPLDILINNAGAWPATPRKSKDGYQEIFQVNHLSHFLLTNLLLDSMKKTAERRGVPSRVVTLSSGLHKVGTLYLDQVTKGNVISDEAHTASPYQAYSSSKLLNVIFANELQRRIDASLAYKGKITSTSVHPGVIVTSLHRDDEIRNPAMHVAYKTVMGIFGKSVVGGAQTTIHAAISSKIERTGGVYLMDCAVASHHETANDEAAGKEVWKISKKLSKIGGIGL